AKRDSISRIASTENRASSGMPGFYTCAAVSQSNATEINSAVRPLDGPAMAARLRDLASEAGFQRFGISGIELGEDEAHLRDWLAQGLYGSMDWMARHGDKRSRPAELVPGTLRVISVGLDYGTDDESAWQTLADGTRAYVARYAL